MHSDKPPRASTRGAPEDSPDDSLLVGLIIAAGALLATPVVYFYVLN